MQILLTKSTLLLGACISFGVLATATILTLFANSSTKSANPIDQVLRQAVDEMKVPGVVAMVATADQVTYQGASGTRNTTKTYR